MHYGSTLAISVVVCAVRGWQIAIETSESGVCWIMQLRSIRRGLATGGYAAVGGQERIPPGLLVACLQA